MNEERIEQTTNEEEITVDIKHEDALTVYWVLRDVLCKAETEYEETRRFGGTLEEIAKKRYNQTLEALNLINEALGYPYGTDKGQFIA